MACAAELAAAESCVTASASACSLCIPAFSDFKTDYENEYKRTLAFEAPGTEIFCERSNFYVCEVMKESDCCCNAEIDAWAKCAYEKELGSLFDVTCSNGCGAAAGDGGGGGEGGSMMIIIIAAVVVVLLCCCGGGCWYRCRKRRLISGKGSTNGESSDDNSWSDEDIESNKRGKRGKKKKNNKKGRKADDSNDSDDDSYYGSKSGKKRKGRKGSKKSLDSDDESSSSESVFDKKKKSKKKGGRSRSSSNVRSSKYSSDSDSDGSDDWKSRNSGKRSKSKKARGGDSSSEEDEDEARSLKSSRASKNKKKQPTVEESIRQGRTILKSVKSSKDTSTEMQETMNREMNALIAQLKTQRLEMEEKLRASEQEAAQLRREKESPGMGLATSVCGTGIDIVTPESELEAVRKEREQMSKMIQKLEGAKNQMAEKLKKAEDEAEVLKTENVASVKRVSEVTKEKDALKAKIEQIESTRGNIKLKLQDAEDVVTKLKAEKRMKSREIRDMRGSVHNRTFLDEAEEERRLISDQLQQQEFEREQMLHMMEQLEEARSRLECGSQAVRRGSNRSFSGLGGGLSRSGSNSSLGQLEENAYMEPPRPGMTRVGSAKSLLQLDIAQPPHQPMQRSSSFSGLVPAPSNARPTLPRNTYQSMRDVPSYDHQSYAGMGQFDSQSHAGLGQFDHQSYAGIGQYDNQTYGGVGQFDNQTYAGAGQEVGGWRDDASGTTDSRFYATGAAGWLGDNIAASGAATHRAEPPSRSNSKRKKNKKDPSQHVRTIESDYGNYKVRAKREKARASERKLRERLDSSRSPASLR